MFRRPHIWKIRNREIALGERTFLMGILNVTPDSFSDGGNYLDPDRAYAGAMRMEEQGADIIDIGAESTRPGAQPITAAEELQRLVPVLKRLRDKLSIPISVDTYKAEVAERALELGVEIINDPSGFTLDPLMAKPIVQYGAGVILNHMRGRPETWASLGPLPDVMGTIIKDLDASVNRARRSGVDRLRVMIDPGIGFGKRREQNSEILARLGEMARLELPILVGVSRKSFLAQAGERETEFATAAAVAACVLNGAHIVRVHDVAEMKAVLAVADDVSRAKQRLAEARDAAWSEISTRRNRGVAQTPQIRATAPSPPVRPPLARSAPPPPAPPPAVVPLPPPAARDVADRAERPAARESRPLRSGNSRGDRDRPGGSRSEGPPRGGSPRPEGRRPVGPRREGPPRSQGRPRPDGPRRSQGSRTPDSRREGPARSQGSRPFGPRREGPPRPRGAPPGPHRDGAPRSDSGRPPGPRSEGPPQFKGSRPSGRPGGRPSGSRPQGPRKGGAPRDSRPRPRHDK